MRESSIEGHWLTVRTEMKYIVAALYSNYTTSIVDDSGIEQTDAYTAPPKSDKLLIELSPIKSG